MKLADIGYVAGIIDGEGWIGLSSPNRKWGRQIPQICVSMADEDVVRKLKAITGVGNVTIRPPQKGREHHKTIYRWTVYKGADAAGVLMTIWPLLGERRRAKAEAVLLHWRNS